MLKFLTPEVKRGLSSESITCTGRTQLLNGQDAGRKTSGTAVLLTRQRLLAAEGEQIANPRGVSFIIRETAYKYQHSVTQVALWRKR